MTFAAELSIYPENAGNKGSTINTLNLSPDSKALLILSTKAYAT